MALKYQKIADELRNKITTGVYPPDSTLPPELELCNEYGVSRQTIRAALQCLVDEGMIQRRQGSGSRVLRKQDTLEAQRRTVAIVTRNITDYIFPSILRKAEAILAANNCAIMLYATTNQVTQERRILLDLLRQKHIDGLLVEGTKAALPNPNLDLYQKFIDKGIPLVFFHGNYPELKGAVSVLDDNYTGGRMLVDYLVSKGHNRIAGFFKADDLQGHQRYSGFMEACRDHDLPITDENIYWYFSNYKDIVENGNPLWEIALSPVIKDCTAVVCYNDQVASPLIEYLQNRGIRVPQDMAVVSFDNSLYSSLSSTRITYLSHTPHNVGSIVAQALVDLLDGKEVHDQLVPWTLVEKESS